MRTITFKLPTIDQVTFDVICTPEYSPIKGNASAIDAETDLQIEKDIIDQLEGGNEWAWCCIQVKASFKNCDASDYLGCCSYASKEDFISNSGYFEDMKQTSFGDLLAELENLND